MKRVNQDGLTYLIDENEQKAKIVDYYEDRNNFLIPRSIKYKSKEYIVISISKDAFEMSQNIKSIRFESDSELQIIEKDAFTCSSIESIFIPASVIDIKAGWCIYADKLTTVKIDPKNSRYSYLDDQLIICKTTETNENYDEIVFGRRDIKEIKVPSFIKIIGPYAFGSCKQLRIINIPSNSELQTIEKEAFFESSIPKIFIPPQVTKIYEYAFTSCQQLQQISIPSNSELQTIEEGAFSFSSIERIFIPLHVTKISGNLFSFCDKLQGIEIPSNSELQTIEKEAFKCSSIESIFIPHHITKISEDAFLGCKKLILVEIEVKSGIELYDISKIFPRGVIIMIPFKYMKISHEKKMNFNILLIIFFLFNSLINSKRSSKILQKLFKK